MAFEDITTPRRQLVLHPLMDIFFILMLFFMLVAAVSKDKMEGNPIGVDYLVPQTAPGEANALIQIISNDSFFWIDYTSNLPEGPVKIDSNQINSNLLTYTQLENKLRNFILENASQGGAKFFFVLRSPINLRYGDVKNLQDRLKTNIKTCDSCKIIKFALIVGNKMNITGSSRNSMSLDLN